MRIAPNPNSGARFKWNDQISNGATWSESFTLSYNGAEISGANTSTWKLVLKRDGVIVQTLTSGTEITVTQNTTYTGFAIDCDVSDLCGDYDADLAAEAVSGTVTHWCSGSFTFNEEDLGF